MVVLHLLPNPLIQQDQKGLYAISALIGTFVFLCLFSEMNLNRDTIEAFISSKESSFTFIILWYLCKASDNLLPPRTCKIELNQQIDPKLSTELTSAGKDFDACWLSQSGIDTVSSGGFWKRPISCFSFGCFWFLIPRLGHGLPEFFLRRGWSLICSNLCRYFWCIGVYSEIGVNWIPFWSGSLTPREYGNSMVARFLFWVYFVYARFRISLITVNDKRKQVSLLKSSLLLASLTLVLL